MRKPREGLLKPFPAYVRIGVSQEFDQRLFHVVGETDVHIVVSQFNYLVQVSNRQLAELIV